MSNDNLQHAYRHARHALEDFQALKPEGELAHSLWHHLRHVVYRLGLEMPRRERVYVERAAEYPSDHPAPGDLGSIPL